MGELRQNLLPLAHEHVQKHGIIIHSGEKCPDFIQRKRELAQPADGSGLLHVGAVEVAISGLRVDFRWNQQAFLVVEMNGFQGKAGDSGELADAEQWKRSFQENSQGMVRSPPRAESREKI